MTTIELLHWNDVHGRFDGLARLSARAKEIRELSPHPVLLLDGGDVEEASVRLSALTYGVAGWRLLGAADVDAAVVGNGGMLRYGPGVLGRYGRALGSPPLVCDVELDGGVPDGAAASVMLSAGDVMVGAIGATDYYPQYASYGLAERGRVTAVRNEADRLRGHGANLVVLLSHCGLSFDRGISWALRGKVDVVVGGHTHDVLTEGDRSAGVPIAQAGCFAEHLGRIRLDVDDEGVRVVDIALESVAENAAGDPVVLSELAACERELADWLAAPVGSMAAAANCSDDSESDVASLLADALLAHTPGDLAVVVAAQCTAGLPSGRVTRGDVWAATSSPANPCSATVPGAELKALIQKGVSSEYAETVPRTFRGRPRGYLHLAGAEVRDGVITVGGEALDDDRHYRVTGTDHELSTYGELVSADPADLRIHAPTILPELLERYLLDHPGARVNGGRLGLTRT